ncbi:four helix bundle protein [Patescibacteria group bacterium]|nr:four helix bundle protein [Patescibacteria group bacterium]MBU4512859.1 four helix bundle protein [Patescibacteria group bacterium]MCG2693634.1 four helix bundle protein [Candidatus Parcubacteria bacterium]
MGVKNFYELDAWKKSKGLTKDIYKVTESFPAEEKYNIISQKRRAIVSVCTNIAEGFGRFFYKDKKRFYYQARGSIQEVQALLILSYELEYLSKGTYIDLFQKSTDVSKLMNGLIASVGGSINPSDE